MENRKYIYWLTYIAGGTLATITNGNCEFQSGEKIENIEQIRKIEEGLIKEHQSDGVEKISLTNYKLLRVELDSDHGKEG